MNKKTPDLLLLILGALAGAFLFPSSAQADPYDKLAESIAGMAKRTGYSRIAVMPRPTTAGSSAT